MTPFMFAQLEMCSGCPKNPKWSAGAGWICPIYRDAHKTISARRQVECFFNQKTAAAVAEKKLNPLKAAKRARRGK